MVARMYSIMHEETMHTQTHDEACDCEPEAIREDLTPRTHGVQQLLEEVLAQRPAAKSDVPEVRFDRD